MTSENSSPVAVDDGLSGFLTDASTPFTTESVLENDSDPDGDELTIGEYQSVTSNGALVTHLGDGRFLYDPNEQFEDVDPTVPVYDQFTYTVTDGVDSDTATVTITLTGQSCVELRAELSELETEKTKAQIEIEGLSEQIDYYDQGVDWSYTAAIWNVLPSAAHGVLAVYGGTVAAVGTALSIGGEIYSDNFLDFIVNSTGASMEEIGSSMQNDIFSGRASGGTKKLIGEALGIAGKLAGEIGTVGNAYDLSELKSDFEGKINTLSGDLELRQQELSFLDQEEDRLEGLLASCPDAHDIGMAMSGMSADMEIA